MPRPGWCRLCTLTLWSVMGFWLAAPLDIAHAAQQQPKVTARRLALEDGEVQLMVGRGDTVFFESALNLDEEIAVIVQFSAPPLLVPGAMPGVPAQQMMQFDSDLPRLEGELSRLRPALYQAGLSRIDHRYSRVFNGVALRARRRLLVEIGDLRYVARVHPDREVRTVLSESVPLIGADKLWETLGIRGEGTVIGIIDTGIDYTHPALGGGLGPGFKVIGGYDFVNDDSDPMDDHGHGTHVAGIAAGNGSEVIGVAPEAQLLGFKVLSAGGWGSFSDVIAGIERAVDPDQDPTTDDAADVINLSLGGQGDPDDPVSQAIDNVTAAGIVAVIAAGNSGNYQTIGSPGTARTAITVGATTKSDEIAWFSSRGPNTKTLSIKPDLTAPGHLISSAALGGGTIAFSGTSMATPHVAGLSALLRQLHPQWTPAMIKAALMQTGLDLGEDVFTQGSGRVDAVRAASPAGLLIPGSISLGLDDISADIWTTADTLTLFNSDTIARTYDLTVVDVPVGVTANASPAVLSLFPGDSAQVVFELAVDNAVVPFPSQRPYHYEGKILAVSDADTMRVPFAFVKSPTLLLAFDEEPWLVMIHDGTRILEWMSYPGTSRQVLLRPGTYDVLTWYTDVRTVVVKEGVQVSGADSVVVSKANAVHDIQIRRRDEFGQEIFGSGTQTFLGHVESGIWVAIMGGYPDRRFSPVSDNYRWEWVSQAYADDKNYRFVGMLEGVSADSTFENRPDDLRHRVFHYSPPADVATLNVARWTGHMETTPSWAYAIRVTSSSDQWQMTAPFIREAYWQPNPIADFFWGWEMHTPFTSYGDLWGSQVLQSPDFALSADDSVAAHKFDVGLPILYTTGRDTLEVGLGPPRWNGRTANMSTEVRARAVVSTRNLFLSHSADTYVGRFFRYRLLQGEEVLAADSVPSSSNGPYNVISIPVSPGAYTLEVTSHEYSIGDAPGSATVRLDFDTNRGDPNPPYLTELFLLSGDAFREVLAGPEEKIVRFALADEGIVQAATLQISPAGSDAWVDVALSEDAGGWAATLPPHLSDGLYDLRVEAEDGWGNRMSYLVSPAFMIEGAPAAVLAVADTSASLGDTVFLATTLTNAVEIAGMDYELALDDSIGLLRYLGSELADRAAGFEHSVVWDSVAKKLKGILIGASGASIAPGQGAVVRHRFLVPAGDSVSARIAVMDTALVTVEGAGDPNAGLPRIFFPVAARLLDFQLADVTGNPVLGAAVPGRLDVALVNTDVDFSVEVNVLDIVRLVNVFMGDTAFTDMEFLVADAYPDGEIDVTDVVRALNILLGRPVGGSATLAAPYLVARRSRRDRRFGERVHFGLEPVLRARPAEDPAFEVSVTVPAGVVGLQLTVRYDPDALALGDPLLALDDRYYRLAARRDDGEATFMLYSPVGRALEQGSHSILTLPVELSAAGGGNAEAELVLVRAVAVDRAGKRAAIDFDLSASVPADDLPDRFSLGLNYPNPFTPATGTRIDVAVPDVDGKSAPLRVTVNIYSIRGRQVRTLVDEQLTAGRYTFEWDGTNDYREIVNSGIYLLVMQAERFRERRRVVLIR